VPLFYFHLVTPVTREADESGLECQSLDEAYLLACHSIPGLAAELLAGQCDPMGCAFELADEHGTVLMVVPFNERVAMPRKKPQSERLARRNQSVDPLLERLARVTREVHSRSRQLHDNIRASHEAVARFRGIEAELRKLRSGGR